MEVKGGQETGKEEEKQDEEGRGDKCKLAKHVKADDFTGRFMFLANV